MASTTHHSPRMSQASPLNHVTRFYNPDPAQRDQAPAIVGWIVRCLSTKRYHAPLMEPEVSFLPRQVTSEIKKSILPVPAVGISATSASPRLIQMIKTVRCLDDNALDSYLGLNTTIL